MRLSCGHITEAFGTKTNSKRQEGCGACSESAEVIRWALQPPNRTLIPSALLCTGQENAGSRRDNAMRKLHNMYTHINIFHTHTHTLSAQLQPRPLPEKSVRAVREQRWGWAHPSSEGDDSGGKESFLWPLCFQRLWIFIQVWPLTSVWGQEASFIKSEHL